MPTSAQIIEIMKPPTVLAQYNNESSAAESISHPQTPLEAHYYSGPENNEIIALVPSDNNSSDGQL